MKNIHEAKIAEWNMKVTSPKSLIQCGKWAAQTAYDGNGVAMHAVQPLTVTRTSG